MPLDELSGPDLASVVADAKAAGLEYVVIGGFSVIYHGHVRATKDSDLLVPDGSEADAAILRFLERANARRLSDHKILTAVDVVNVPNLRVNTRNGIVGLLRGGLPPLDFETVAARAETVEFLGESVRVAGLASVVGFKRLARPDPIVATCATSKPCTGHCRSSRSLGSTPDLVRRLQMVTFRAHCR